MRRGGDWGASRYVHCALAVVEQEGCACPLRVAMPSTATSPTALLASALSLPRPAIALDAISEPLLHFLLLLEITFVFIRSALLKFGGASSFISVAKCEWGKHICVRFLKKKKAEEELFIRFT